MENTIDTIIGLHATLKGNLKNQGSIQINGTVEGEVRSDEHIIVGETAKIQGPVIAKTVEVSGTVVGLIEASERLEIKPTGHVTGDINAKSLIIQQGATFVGKSIMPGADKATETEASSDKAPEAPVKETAKDPEEKEVKEEKTDEPKDDKKEHDRDPLGFFRK